MTLSKVEKKFDKLIERFAYKLENSVTPVPGLIIGLSGTDSIVSYMAAICAVRVSELEDRIPILGVH